MAKIKNDRVNEEFRRVLSEIVTNEIGDDRVSGKCSIMNVEVTPDLAYAKVFISVMGDDKAKEKALISLNHAKGFLKKRLSDIVIVRKIPDLTFVLDTSIDHSIKIATLLEEIKSKEAHNE